VLPILFDDVEGGYLGTILGKVGNGCPSYFSLKGIRLLRGSLLMSFRGDSRGIFFL